MRTRGWAAVVTLILASGCATAAAHVSRVRPAIPTPTGSPRRVRARVLPLVPDRQWMVRRACAGPEVEGYANVTDVAPGAPVTLYISTRARSLRVQAFRIGWYGGAGAARGWQSPVLTGAVQAPAMFEPSTRTIWAPWRPTTTVSTSGWDPGDYLLRLDASNGCQSFVPLTVRSPSVRGRVVLVNEVATWQAYNSWGGYDLYHGPAGSRSHRSYSASFDRPYDGGNGSGDFIIRELAAVEYISRLHIPEAFLTSIDLSAGPHALDGARAVISLGHDEYYSAGMRNALVQARAKGVNLAFLGANSIYRHVRFAASPLGPNRLEINYKARGLDPIERTDPAGDTVSWRNNVPAEPESRILGEWYACINLSDSPLVVADPGSWLLAGYGLHRGERFNGLVGNEADAVGPIAITPRPIDAIFHSPIGCKDRPYADTAYSTTSSGAGVFDAGTMRWECALAAGMGPGACSGRPASAAGSLLIQHITARLLTVFARGPAGRTHPAVDNLTSLPGLRSG